MPRPRSSSSRVSSPKFETTLPELISVALFVMPISDTNLGGRLLSCICMPSCTSLSSRLYCDSLSKRCPGEDGNGLMSLSSPLKNLE